MFSSLRIEFFFFFSCFSIDFLATARSFLFIFYLFLLFYYYFFIYFALLHAQELLEHRTKKKHTFGRYDFFFSIVSWLQQAHQRRHKNNLKAPVCLNWFLREHLIFSFSHWTTKLKNRLNSLKQLPDLTRHFDIYWVPYKVDIWLFKVRKRCLACSITYQYLFLL